MSAEALLARMAAPANDWAALAQGAHLLREAAAREPNRGLAAMMRGTADHLADMAAGNRWIARGAA